MKKEQLKKEFQNLCSWAEFYRVNQRLDDFNKAQLQIEAFKKKHKFE